VDDDGYEALECGGPDCNDLDASINPNVATDLNLSDVLPGNQARQVLQVLGNAADQLLVLYREGEQTLRLATWTDGTWTSELVTSLPVRSLEGARMVIDPDGSVHVAFTSEVPESNPLTRDVYYATNAGGAWAETQLTDSAGGDATGYRPAIALDGEGTVHIVFDGDGLEHVTNASGSWATQTLSASVGSYSLATSPSGSVHLAFSSAYHLNHGSFVGGTFEQAPVIEDAGGGETTAVFDATGRLHVATNGFDAQYERVLEYTIIDGTDITRVDTQVARPDEPQFSLAPNGQVHLFSDIKLSSGHLVGMVGVVAGDLGAEVTTVHSTPSYVQEDFGFAWIDAAGRLHRVTPGGVHSYSDEVDHDCDGSPW
jgi:hypothetical protein